MRWKTLCIAVAVFSGLTFLSAAAARATLGDAVGAPGLTWTTGGDADWFEQTGTSRTGGSSAQSGAVGDSQVSFIETTVTGQAWIKFYWSVSSQADQDYLIFSIDGVEKARLSGSIPFVNRTYRIGSGTHTLRWEYLKDGAGSSGSDCGWLDDFEVYDSYTLAEAVDDTLFTWFTGGDEGWFGTEWQFGHDGDMAQSGVISDSQSSWLETTVPGPGLFTGTWAVYSEAGSDYLSFHVDGIPTERISGTGGGTREIALQSGSHLLRWEYAKDAAGTASADYGVLDEVFFAGALPLADVLDSPALSFTTGGDSEWIGRSETRAYNNNDAQSGILDDGQSAWIETTVDGPGHISFNHGIQEAPGGSSLLRFSVDGTQEKSYGYTVLGGYAANGPYGHPVPPGTHTFRWTFDKDSAGTDGYVTAWLDRVFFLPPVDLGEALDNTSLTWTTGGDAEWMGQTVFTQSYSADDAAQSGMIGDDESSWIGTTVTGPGILQYSWKTTSEGNSDYLSFSINSALQDQISGGSSLSPGGWSSARRVLPSGVHTLRWEYAKDGSGTWSNDSGYLNAVQYTPAIPLGEALDNTSLTWTTGGDSEWIGQDDYVNGDGNTGDAAESGPIGDGQSTWIETTVDGPGLLTFYASVFAEVDHDFLVVSLDGVELRRTSTNYSNLGAAYYPFMVIIPAGSHAVRWTYTKDASGSEDRDHALLDEVTFTPLTDLDEALDNTDLAFSTGGDAAWGGQTLVSHYDGDAAAAGWIGVGEASWIETTVSGPGLISFFWNVRAANGPYHDFEEHRYVLPAGDHTLRWTYSRTAEHSQALLFTDNGAVKEQIADADVDFDHSALLDQIIYDPGLPLETVLHNPDVPSDVLSYTTGGDAQWQGVWMEEVGGAKDLAISGWIEDSRSSWLETTVDGPGELSFSWAVSSQIYNDYLKFYLDGAFKEEASGGVAEHRSNYYTARQAIPAGTHTVRWEYVKDSAVGWGADWAKVDWVAFNPGVPLADALDGPGITWATGGGAPWVGISRLNSMSLDLTDAAQSGLLAPGETSWLETTVTGPGVFSFWNSKQFGNSPDDLSFLVDGVDDPLDEPGIYWGRNGVVLAGGSHTLRWEHTRSDALGLGVNSSVIDLAHWEPTVPIAEAVDNTDLVWTTGGVAAPYGQTTVFENDGDAVRTAWAGGGESWLETTVDGPGYLAFSWKVSEGTPNSHFAFLIDGSEFHRINNTTEWERVWLAVPAGTHTLRWLHDGSYYTTSRNHGHDCGWLDNVVYTPPVPLQEALDDPALTWNTGGDAEWFGEIDDFVYGASAAQSGNKPGYGGTSWLETVVTGPKIVSFDWKSENGDSYGAGSRLSLKINGTDKFGIANDTDWGSGYLPVPGGSHILRWEHFKERGHEYGEKGFLDHLRQSTPIPLAEALDNDYLIFTTGAGREWLGQARTSMHGGSAAQSTAIGHLDSSWVETTVHGPGTLSFYWKVSSDHGDWLAFIVDSSWEDSITGTVDWTEVTYAVPAGEHVIRWEYSKDSNFTHGYDTGVLDRVIYTADAASTVCPSGCDFADIQSAIAAAVPMQTILVMDGHYTGQVDFLGKIITLVSENGPEHTVIDAGGGGTAVTFAGGEGPQSILDGFTVTGGTGFVADGGSGDDPGTYGGGIYGEFVSPTIRNCIVSGNGAPHRGGGAYFYSSAPLIENTYVRGNSSQDGGGLFFNLSNAEMVNVSVSGNSAGAGGGGLYLSSSDIVAINGTVASNTASTEGGGVKSETSSPLFVNTILWGNEAAALPDQIGESVPGMATVLYSDVEGGDPGSPGAPWPGAGNIDGDPSFVDLRPATESPTTAGNYGLAPLSSCIDSGTDDAVTYTLLPADDIEGHARSQGAGYDMGADEHVFRGDWNADGMPDLFWQHAVSRANYLWYMNGSAITGGAAFPTVADTDWAVGVLADFDGDGKLDILWRNTATGVNYLWYMDGPAVTGADPVNAAGTVWDAAAAADFDSDGKPDLLWRNTISGVNYLWYMDGAAVVGSEILPAAGTDWSLKSADDFNGDGSPDLLWRNTVTGDAYLWYLDGTAVVGGDPLPPVSLNWTIDGTADFDGDGKPDICWRNYGSGENYLWYMDGVNFLGGAGVPPVGDPDWHIEQ